MVKQQIQTKALNLWFGDNHVLHDVDISIGKNQVTAIIGPSGCGKSTLIRCFNRMNDLILDTKIKGKVLLDNEDIYSSGANVTSIRTRVGMVFQKPNPFPKSIFNNVAYGMQIRGKYNKAEVKDRVEKSLRDAWIWDEVKDRLHESAMSLSGGQQQRLCIARALTNNPEVLLLDEPTSSLIPNPPPRSRNSASTSKARSPSSSLPTTSPRQAGYRIIPPLCISAIWSNLARPISSLPCPRTAARKHI